MHGGKETREDGGGGEKENKVEGGKSIQTKDSGGLVPCVQSLANIKRRVEHFTPCDLQKIDAHTETSIVVCHGSLWVSM